MNTYKHTMDVRWILPWTILLGLFLVSPPSLAQDTLRTRERDKTQQQDKTREQERIRQQDKIQQQEKTRQHEQTQQQVQEQMKKNFVDKNADGVDDRLQERRRRGMTPFVDADGDGIADDRAQGMGFRRGKNMTGSPMDKSSPGGKKYRGGRDQ